MLAGPLFVREALTSPRQIKHFATRAGYLASLFVLMYTATQATFGWQSVRTINESARFGSLLFQVFSLVQLTLVLFFSTLFAAGNIAQEKDRRTMLMLLMTDLRDSELVLGKLTASLLIVAVLLLASLPALVGTMILGGVTLEQVGWSLAVAAVAGYAGGSWGTLVSLWREKTFQTLAISVLGIMLFLGAVELVVLALGTGQATGTPPTPSGWSPGLALGLLNPYRGMFAVLDPFALPVRGLGLATLAGTSVLGLGLLGSLLNAVSVVMLRVWNPSRSVNDLPVTEEDRAAGRTRQHRKIWDAPVIWREMRTRAYGRKMLAIKLAYLVIAGGALWATLSATEGPLILGMISQAGFAFVGIAFVSMLLINAQAVTAITSERDGATLELLLVTEVSAKEFIYGKLGGVLYNTRELILVPPLLLLPLVLQDQLTIENFAYVTFGFLVLCVFSAMLGLHSGLSYFISRTAIANSLGTLFFLFVGILICMMLIVQARSSFALQLPCFLLFILGGSLGLWASLTHRNPSPALTLSAWILPFCTFYAITSFLLGQTLGVALFVSAAYGFTTIAMLVPAISEFDVALGRSSGNAE